MADGDWLAVDLAELRAAGTAMLALGDAVEVLGRAEVLGGRGAYGSWALADAAGRFADRYGHLVRCAGGALCDAGEVLRATADDYAEVDVVAPITQLAGELHDRPGQALV